MSVKSAIHKACIFCGLKSHRHDWQDTPHPLCDNHTPEEKKMAIAALQPEPDPFQPSLEPPATPVEPQ
jgi:hypothetical protein